MKKSELADVSVTASLSPGGREFRMEKLSTGESGGGAIRFSSWKNEKLLPGPLELSEKEFIELIHQAIHAGVLSQNFEGKLRERIEI